MVVERSVAPRSTCSQRRSSRRRSRRASTLRRRPRARANGLASRRRSTRRRIRCEQMWFVSKDGTRVPMFVLARARDAARRDGARRALRLRRLQRLARAARTRRASCRGSMPAACTRSRTCAAAASSAKPGIATACSRASRTSSTISSRRRSFSVTSRIADPERIAVMGGSNGGLLVAAFATQRPDLVARRRLPRPAHRHVALCGILDRTALDSGVRRSRRPGPMRRCCARIRPITTCATAKRIPRC